MAHVNDSHNIELSTELGTKLKKYRLNQKEYDSICKLLGREPQNVEWALFSALWSEHCSYKSSKIHLRKFYNKNESVLVSEGENSGVIDLGQGERISFKMESHNHPSFIEPYQGAATGVGGILRDIFTMGARPIMLANYLCFGEMDAPRMKTLVKGVVGGISGYGNCVGVPNTTGFTEFHSSYNKNILVNAFALGVLYPGEELALSAAQGEGDDVVYVGARTGRDGIHGASMASESFDDKASANKPTIQIGDPFFEKCLIESCLEVIATKKVIAIQDMGAAGLISSSFEMASKGGVGLELNLDQVPLRDSSLTPEDILLSESQERMLLVCEPKNFEAINAIFTKWGLEATRVGKVLKQKKMKLIWHGETLTEIDPDLLVENAPRYDRPHEKYVPQNRSTFALDIFRPDETLRDIFESDFGSSKNWIFNQYDQRVGSQTARDCSASIGVVRLEKSKRALGLALGCRPYLMRLDARIGALDAVFHPALQLACKGFKPLAVTDCLNFASPENPKIMTEFVTSVESISQACEALDTPVISGNVSFYNETLNQGITSTPGTGLVGIKDSIEAIPQDHFVKANSSVYLVYEHQIQTGGALQEQYKNKVTATPGDIDCSVMAEFVENIRQTALDKNVLSSRVSGKYGVLPTATLMSSADTELNITANVPFLKASQDLFTERLYEVLFEVENGTLFEKILFEKNLKFVRLGLTQKISLKTLKLKERYMSSFGEKL